MSSILEKNPTPLELIIPEPVYFLRNIIARYNWVDGKPTSDILGYLYEASNTDSYTDVSVFIAGKAPVIPVDEFQARRLLKEKFYVEFEQAFISIWFNYKTKQIDDKVVATSIRIVEIV
ncbi:hypothetical protein DSECCO2_443300 [anaerobic digester metagenome]